MISLRMRMYSPKIKEELVPQLYKMAKQRKIPMTKLVNEILETALDENELYRIHGIQPHVAEKKDASNFSYEK